jgi:hypothetical protein
MNKPFKKVLEKILFALVGSFFILAAVFSMFAPLIVPQIGQPENIAGWLLFRAKTWPTLQPKANTAWEASDGITAGYVTHQPTEGGIRITLGPTQSNTREAYFASGVLQKRAFTLQAEVNTPAGCHNGLVFRGNAQGEYYVFLVSESSYTVEILRREANTDLPREALIPNTDVSEAVGKPQRLMIVGNAERYFFYINDLLVNQLSDSRLNGKLSGVEVFT